MVFSINCSTRKHTVKVQRPKPVIMGVGYDEVGTVSSAATAEEDHQSHDHFGGCLAGVSVFSRRNNLAFPCSQQ